MARRFQLRRFSRPATLKSIDVPLLRRFLAPHRAFFDARGMDVTGHATDFDYEGLARLLMMPDVDAPESLLDALFFVDEVAHDGLYDALFERAIAEGIPVSRDSEIGPADLAVLVWLEKPEVLERFHAEQFLTRPKRFESFVSPLAAATELPDVSVETCHHMEDDLNAFFETHRKGRGTRVFPFVRDDGIWFLVRHGQPIRREGTVEPDGSSKNIYYRPEKFDVLVYFPEHSELTIHTSTKGECGMYCRVFGEHVFGDPDFFRVSDAAPRYALSRILREGRNALVCSDIEGMRAVRLVELQVRHGGGLGHREIHKADDVFDALDDIGRDMPADAEPIRAGFKVLFSDSSRWRTVTLCVPNAAVYDRDSDGEIINFWLRQRGFLREQPDDAIRSRPAEVLALS
jgi:hypothetical protein